MFIGNTIDSHLKEIYNVGNQKGSIFNHTNNIGSKYVANNLTQTCTFSLTYTDGCTGNRQTKSSSLKYKRLQFCLVQAEIRNSYMYVVSLVQVTSQTNNIGLLQ